MWLRFTLPLKFTLKIYHHNLTLQEAKDDQEKLEILINKLNNNYNPTSKIKIKERNDTLHSTKTLYTIKNEIINAFKKGVFANIDGFQVEKETDEETDEERDEDTDEEIDTTIMPEL